MNATHRPYIYPIRPPKDLRMQSNVAERQRALHEANAIIEVARQAIDGISLDEALSGGL